MLADRPKDATERVFAHVAAPEDPRPRGNEAHRTASRQFGRGRNKPSGRRPPAGTKLSGRTPLAGGRHGIPATSGLSRSRRMSAPKSPAVDLAAPLPDATFAEIRRAFGRIRRRVLPRPASDAGAARRLCRALCADRHQPLLRDRPRLSDDRRGAQGAGPGQKYRRRLAHRPQLRPGAGARLDAATPARCRAPAATRCSPACTPPMTRCRTASRRHWKGCAPAIRAGTCSARRRMPGAATLPAASATRNWRPRTRCIRS